MGTEQSVSRAAGRKYAWDFDGPVSAAGFELRLSIGFKSAPAKQIEAQRLATILFGRICSTVKSESAGKWTTTCTILSLVPAGFARRVFAAISTSIFSDRKSSAKRTTEAKSLESLVPWRQIRLVPGASLATSSR